MIPSVELNALSIGKMIGDGGEGEVFVIDNHPGQVLKLFKDVVRHELNEAGLAATVNLFDSLPSREKDFVAARSAWPHTVVRDNGRLAGFIMPEVDNSYFVQHGQRGNPIEGMNDWNKLAFRKQWMTNPNLESNSPELWYPDGSSLDNLSENQLETRATLLRLLLDVSRLFEILHRYHIVVGDISGRNLLWSRESGETVMLIDCDGCRKESTVGVTRAKQSPDWFDPYLNGPTDIQSDLYKLSVAIYRGYFSDGLGLPGSNTIRLSSDADRRIHAFSSSGVSDSNRPSASKWVSLFEELIQEAENAGRPVLDWTGGAPRPTQAQSPTSTSNNPVRPSITW